MEPSTLSLLALETRACTDLTAYRVPTVKELRRDTLSSVLALPCPVTGSCKATEREPGGGVGRAVTLIY